MAKLKRITELLEKIAPLSIAQEWDNVGLLIEGDEAVTGICVCLDCTQSAVLQAINSGANLIVCHHPVIFSPISKLDATTENSKAIFLAVKHGISVYSMHTNLDAVKGGINDHVAMLYKMKNVCIIDETGKDSGIGRVGDVRQTTVSELTAFTESVFGVKCERTLNDSTVQRIAIVNGGGADNEYLLKAKNMGATCLISGDAKHHNWMYANNVDMSLINVPHYSSEVVYMPVLKEKIERVLSQNKLDINVILAKEEIPFTKNA